MNMGLIKKWFTTKNSNAVKSERDTFDLARRFSFIDLWYNPQKRIWLKVISFFVAFTFFFQQISYSLDASIFHYSSASTLSRIPEQVSGTAVMDENAEEIEITNFDLLSYKRRQEGIEKVLPSMQDQQDSTAYAPYYLRRQQSKHEEIIRQKQDTEDLMLLINNKNLRKQEYKEDLPLKKKKSSEGGGAVYYTLEDHNADGNPMQINVYEYEGGKSSGRLMELVSYDISGLNTSAWEADAEEIEPDEGDPFIGSKKELTNRELLTEDRMIRRTVYSGEKSEERIDHVFSGYGEDILPTEVTLYHYSSDADDANLEETRTYRIKGLELELTTADWKNELGDNLLSRQTFYKGSDEEEKIDYVLDEYIIDDNGVNHHNRITIYDYEKAGDAATLDEIRTYLTTDLRQEDWLVEDEARLENIAVYSGEEDKEKVQYSLSRFFKDEDEEQYVPWERKDYSYDSEDKLTETKTYSVSNLSETETKTMGLGELEETDVFFGEKGYERVDYAYHLYSNDGTPQIRVDYVYDGRTLVKTETYDIAERSADSKEVIQELSVYEGKAGEERISSTESYHADGKIFKSTKNTYAQNSRGIFYKSGVQEIMYSIEGEVQEKIDTENSLEFRDQFDEKQVDQNANIRSQNIKTYLADDGEYQLNQEETVLYLSYTANRRAREEERGIFLYTDEGERKEIERRKVTNFMFSAEGNVLRQTIDSFQMDEKGNAVYDITTVVENHKFDYYGNVLDRTEIVWSDMTSRTVADLSYLKTVKNDYTNRVGARRGNAARTEIIRYNALEKNLQTEIDRVLTETEEFDARGFARRQTTNTFVADRVTDPENVLEKLATKRETENFEIDFRGNAAQQHVLTFRTDADGNFITDLSGKPVEASYQVFSNRRFDSAGNVVSQTLCEYDTKASQSPLEVQEIRSRGFHQSGTAYQQIIATYTDELKTNLLDAKVIVNTGITANGNVTKMCN